MHICVIYVRVYTMCCVHFHHFSAFVPPIVAAASPKGDATAPQTAAHISVASSVVLSASVSTSSVPWLLIVVPTVPRPSGAAYLSQTIDHLLSHMPHSPLDPFFGQVKILVAHMKHGNKQHPTWQEQRARFNPATMPLPPFVRAPPVVPAAVPMSSLPLAPHLLPGSTAMVAAHSLEFVERQAPHDPTDPEPPGPQQSSPNVRALIMPVCMYE
jgi:hypothetical protein